MIKLLKFSFLPSFYCSVSIWCSKDQLKSLVTVETSPDCPPTAACLPPGPRASAPGCLTSPDTPAPSRVLDQLGLTSSPAAEGSEGERETNCFPELASNSDLASKCPSKVSRESEEGKTERGKGSQQQSKRTALQSRGGRRGRGSEQWSPAPGASPELGGEARLLSLPLAPPPTFCQQGFLGLPGTEQRGLVPDPAQSHCFSSQHPQVQVHLGVTSCLVAPGNQTGQT